MFEYLVNLAIFAAIAAVNAAALNLLVGYSGIFSIAQAAFYGVGGYATALVSLHLGTSLPLAVGVAVAACCAFSVLLALPAGRVTREYFAVASLAFEIVIFTVFGHWTGVTGGAAGLVGVPRLTVGGLDLESNESYLGLAVVVLAVTVVVLYAVVHSRLGRSLRALRDDPVAAQALGQRPFRLRLVAVMISAALSALAGVVYAGYVGFVGADGFAPDASVLILAMVIIGGAGTLSGPVIGAVFITVVPVALEFLAIPDQKKGPLEQAIYGILIVLLAMYRPDGIAGLFASVGERVRRRVAPGTTRAPGPAPAPAPEAEVPPRRPAPAPTGGAMLDIRELSRSFGGNRVIPGLTWSVPAGGITALIGPNGAGKTTIFNLVTGFLRPDGGTITYRGRRIDTLAPSAIFRRGIGRTFQEMRVFEGLSVLDNVLVGIEHGTFSRSRALADRERAMAALRLLGLDARAAVTARNLSYAEQKFLSLARVLAAEPELVLLDEPTSGLDGPSLDLVITVISRLAARGAAVLLIEHNLDVVRRVVDSIAFLDGGRLLAVGTERELLSRADLADVYFGGGVAR